MKYVSLLLLLCITLTSLPTSAQKLSKEEEEALKAKLEQKKQEIADERKKLRKKERELLKKERAHEKQIEAEKEAIIQEKKDLIAELDAFEKDLDSFKRFKKVKANAELMVDSLMITNDEFEGEKSSLNSRIAELEAEVSKLTSTITELEDQSALKDSLILRLESKDPEARALAKSRDGFVYRIQIGANDENKEYTEYIKENVPIMDVEEKKDGVNRFVFGYFSTMEDAKKFKKFLVGNANLKDAWIIPYKQGDRIITHGPNYQIR